MSLRKHWQDVRSSVVPGDVISGCRDNATRTYRLFVNKGWREVQVGGGLLGTGHQISSCECCDLSIEDLRRLVTVLQEAIATHEPWPVDEEDKQDETERLTEPCPHEATGGQHRKTMPDYHPLCWIDIRRLLRKVFAATGSERIKIATAVQIRLAQGIPGMTCPRPRRGKVVRTEIFVKDLYLAGIEGDWDADRFADVLHRAITPEAAEPLRGRF